jgi:hypothetical protein
MAMLRTAGEPLTNVSLGQIRSGRGLAKHQSAPAVLLNSFVKTNIILKMFSIVYVRKKQPRRLTKRPKPTTNSANGQNQLQASMTIFIEEYLCLNGDSDAALGMELLLSQSMFCSGLPTGYVYVMAPIIHLKAAQAKIPFCVPYSRVLLKDSPSMRITMQMSDILVRDETRTPGLRGETPTTKTPVKHLD